jgi:putative flippase GtrA
VTSPPSLYRRVRRHEVTGQFVRFASVGVFNFLSYFAIYNALLHFGLHAVASTACAFAITSVSSFFLNKFWSFRDLHRRGIVRQYAIFTLFTLVGLGINSGAVAVFLIPFHPYGRLGENAAALCAQPFSMLWNFTAYRRWTFRGRPRLHRADSA